MYYPGEDEYSPLPSNYSTGELFPAGSAPAAFVMKTYQMVNDPATDHLIAWGPANNTFVVVDPLLFARILLPCHFKHSNFSSFIRQLNTYGFRKVDPDRWEFANEWFLRGQKHLLKNIARRKYNPAQMNSNFQQQNTMLRQEESTDEMEREIERLRLEQDEMDREIQVMNRRLETTERRPEQMMAFLNKVVEDPEILPKMMVERERRTRKRQIEICSDGRDDEKRMRLITAASNSGRTTTEEGEGSSSLGVTSSSPEMELKYQFGGGGVSMEGGISMIGATAAAAGCVGFLCDASPAGFEVEDRVPPYPFSLFGGGF
ncbi:hypothetical protein V2J09_018815 [Rumex salicifolius]